HQHATRHSPPLTLTYRPHPLHPPSFPTRRSSDLTSHSVAHLRHAAEHEATKAHRRLADGVPATDVRHAREAEWRSGAAGRRRSAYEAPHGSVAPGPVSSGAESKRRRRPRLPAPPSRLGGDQPARAP